MITRTRTITVKKIRSGAVEWWPLHHDDTENENENNEISKSVEWFADRFSPARPNREILSTNRRMFTSDVRISVLARVSCVVHTMGCGRKTG